ncbi:hypothetical protein ACGFXC_33910 [Streptomyces sp. NPDC048507]|uniref:hypothetical protein n=1 Tax=Streptomyces sp. NPDC048507 TaxID=3365560 RepID=UPI003722CB3F
MATATTVVRRGQPAWLAIAATAAVVLPLTALPGIGRPWPELLPGLFADILAEAAVPGVIALSQYVLVRSGRVELAVVGVAGLSAAVIGVNSAHGNAGALQGILLAALLCLPFALVSAFLAVKADLGYAMAAAVAVLVGAGQLVSEVAPQSVNADAGLLAGLGTVTPVPVPFLVAAALFALVARCAPRQEALLGGGGTGWVRVALVLYVPAFLLAVCAGTLYTARVRAAVPEGLGDRFVPLALLAILAGGASLRARSATLTDIAVGSLFAASFTVFLQLKGVGSARFGIYVSLACIAFLLLDALRLRRVPSALPAPLPAPESPSPA